MKLSDEVNSVLDNKYPQRHVTTLGISDNAPRWDEIIMTYFQVIEDKLSKLEEL